MTTSSGGSSDQRTDDSSNLVDKKNTKSGIWKYFALRINEDDILVDQDKPVCKLCNSCVSAKYGNTSNLYSHLKNQHQDAYAQVLKQSKGKQRLSTDSSHSSTEQPSIVECFQKNTKLNVKSKEHKELTKAITYWLAKDMHPTYSVEKAGFRKMIQKFNPRYELPSRHHFSHIAIPVLYAETCQNVKAGLASSDVIFFAATTDLWSSRAMHPYISYTVHYIDGEWTMKSHCLQTHYMPEDHTGENVKEAMLQTLQDWCLDKDRQVAITTDNGANMVLACNLLGWKRVSCFGHNLDLAIHKGLNDARIQRVLRLCRQVVAKFSCSWKKQKELTAAQEDKQLPLHKLKADCPTRWGSVFDMISRIVEQQEAIRVVLASDRKSAHLIPTWQDFDVLDCVLAVLTPLREMTDLLATEKQVSISALKPLVAHVCDSLLLRKEDDADLTADIKQRIREDLSKRYDDPCIDHLLTVSCFIDPRFKCAEIPEDSRDVLIDSVKEELVEIAAVMEDTQSPIQESESQDSEPPKKKTKSVLGRILGTNVGTSPPANTSQVPSDRAQHEIERYISFPCQEIDSSPLNWWKREETQFPLLSKLARKYLCICATSVASERVFSTGGNIVSDTRNSLKPQRVNELVFLAKNLS